MTEAESDDEEETEFDYDRNTTDPAFGRLPLLESSNAKPLKKLTLIIEKGEKVVITREEQ